MRDAISRALFLLLFMQSELYGGDIKTSRDWISSYHLVIQGKTIYTDKDPEHIKVEVWWNGKSYRSDVWITTQEDFGKAERVVSCTDCDKIGYTASSIQGDKSITSLQYTYDKGIYGGSNIYYQDWRYFGFRHGRVLNSKSDDKSSVSMYLDDPITVTAKENKFSTYTIQNGKQKKVMKVDNESSQPIEFATEFYDTKTVATTHIDLLIDRLSGKKFPKSYSHTTTVKGVEYCTMNYSVTVCELNIQIHPTVFSLKGMSLLDGTPVDLPGASRLANVPTLKNGELDYNLTLSKASSYAMSTMPPQDSIPSTPKPSLISQACPYFLGFVVFAVLGFWLIFKQRKLAKEG